MEGKCLTFKRIGFIILIQKNSIQTCISFIDYNFVITDKNIFASMLWMRYDCCDVCDISTKKAHWNFVQYRVSFICAFLIGGEMRGCLPR
jgi:hypothetical protein